MDQPGRMFWKRPDGKGCNGYAEISRSVVQGGPDSTDVKNMPYFNQWEDLDDSPIGWHITEPVDPVTTDGWLSAVGGGIY